jgi:hypothetical protein
VSWFINNTEGIHDRCLLILFRKHWSNCITYPVKVKTAWSCFVECHSQCVKLSTFLDQPRPCSWKEKLATPSKDNVSAAEDNHPPAKFLLKRCQPLSWSEILCLWCNPKIHYSVYKSPSMAPSQSEVNPIQSPSPYLRRVLISYM